MSHTTDSSEWGYELVGFLSGNFGLSIAARNTLHALECSGEFVRLRDVDPGQDRREIAPLEAAERPGTPRVNLFHVNPNEIRIVAAAQWQELDPLHRLNVAVPFWELPHLPVRGWREILGSMDVILAPSRFVQSAIADALPEARMLHYPQAVFLPKDVQSNRDHFGLPRDSMIFYMSLDLTSDPERKNPVAALRAFAEAFKGGEDVVLAVRANNPGHSRATRDAYELLAAELQGDPRVRVFDQRMDYREVLSLSASTDAYVSLHRSEGLGLNIMEAMSIGNPVVTTGWSGNMDFTNSENALLVSFELVPTVATNPAYAPADIGPNQVWAEPNVQSAARCMRQLFEHPDAARALGARAQQSMAARRRDFERGSVFDELHEIARPLMPLRGDAARARALRATLRDSAWRRAKRYVGRGLRRMGLR